MSRTAFRPRAAGLAAAAALATVIAGCSAPESSSQSAEDLPTDLEELVAAAQEEGEVSIGAGGHTREQVELLASSFEEEYGIEVTFVRASGGDISQQVQAQLSAEALQFDVISLNDEATLADWSEEGVLADPELENRDDILGPLSTPDDAAHVPFTWAAMGYAYNEASTDPASLPTTWADLAQQPGVFAVANPNSSGAALTFVAAMEQIDPDFLPALGQSETLVSDSALALTQLVATGEADFGIPGIEADVATAANAGEPLAMGYPEGEIGVLTSFIAPLADSPHPAAARLLVQYQMSEEFQNIQAGIGSRAVLSGADVPEGAEELSEDRLVVIQAADLSAQKDDLLAKFSEAMGV